MAILDAPDPGPVDAWLRELTETGFDDLILLTGEGLRRLLARARVTGGFEAVVAAVGRTLGRRVAQALTSDRSTYCRIPPLR